MIVTSLRGKAGVFEEAGCYSKVQLEAVIVSDPANVSAGSLSDMTWTTVLRGDIASPAVPVDPMETVSPSVLDENVLH